jgi:HD-GYP domain-containing protein (c-di-GMP phosphodiesterase class II)
MGAEIALGHHERWDGSGYPQALRGEQTPMPARIVGVADVIEALTTARSDRDALRFERVLEYMRSQAGHLFDPEIVKVLLVRGRQVDEVRKAFKAGQPASP